MIYAVLDTNVLVSALLSKSAESTLSKLISAVIQKNITPLYSREIIDEYREVLARKKFHFPIELQKALVNRIINIGIDSERIHFDEVMPDEDDRVFYEVALSRDDAYLVTGNQTYFPVTPIVVTPAEMLEILKRYIYLLCRKQTDNNL